MWVEDEPLPEGQVVDDKADAKPKLPPRPRFRRR
jgi:hypothetical protein